MNYAQGKNLNGEDRTNVSEKNEKKKKKKKKKKKGELTFI